VQPELKVIQVQDSPVQLVHKAASGTMDQAHLLALWEITAIIISTTQTVITTQKLLGFGLNREIYLVLRA
jgi:hypothetical protein